MESATDRFGLGLTQVPPCLVFGGGTKREGGAAVKEKKIAEGKEGWEEKCIREYLSSYRTIWITSVQRAEACRTWLSLMLPAVRITWRPHTRSLEGDFATPALTTPQGAGANWVPPRRLVPCSGVSRLVLACVGGGDTLKRHFGASPES
jgi:hypothetical protein